MYRLIGGHTNHTFGGIPELVTSWQPPVWLVMDPGPEWKWVAQACPRTVFIWRIFNADQPDFNQPLDPVAEARAHVAQVLPWTGNVFGGKWKGVNEPVIASREAMKRFAEFEAERVRLLAAHGLQAVVGGFAVGNPPDLSWWREFEPALKTAGEHGGILGLHQYWWETPQDRRFVDPDWTSLRHRKVYDGEPSHGWEGLENRLPLVMMEGGADCGVWEEGVVEGWNRIRNPEQYKADLNEFSLEIQKDTYVLGVCVFCCGNSSFLWMGYDIWPQVAREIAKKASPLYRKFQPPPEKWARGIDVSSNQKTIKWAQVAKAGYSFAFIRASAGLWKDPQYDRNYKLARKRGLLVGSYHYQRRDQNPREQAQFFTSVAGKPDTFNANDVEHLRGECPSRAQVMAFHNEAGGMDYYTSAWQWDSKCKISPAPWVGRLWVADWAPRRFGNPRLPSDWNGWEFQQYTSRGKVPGIIGNVDLDIFNGTAAELRAQYGGTAK